MKRSVARTVHGAAAFVRTVAEQVYGGDANPVPAEWTHVTKVDPEDGKTLPLLFPAYLVRSSVVSVGGSRDVTQRNTEATFELLEYCSTPAIHEPSAAEHVTEATRERATALAIPEVLNGDVDSLIGKLGQGIEYLRGDQVPAQVESKLPGWLVRRYGDALADVGTSWVLEDAIFEAYIIQNPDSAAAREAGVDESDLLSPAEARRRAMAAERRLGSEVLYLEYSGTFGGGEAEAILEEVSDAVNWSRIWYGGGLSNAEDAAAVREAGADAVVVGDAFHDVAEQERAVCERAERSLSPDADRDEIGAWIADEVDAAAAATRYLSTIPEVDDPEAVATELLAAAVDLWLTIRSIEADLEETDPGADTIRSAVEAAVEAGTLAAVSDVDEWYATVIALAVLGERFDCSPAFPVDHLGTRLARTEAAESASE